MAGICWHCGNRLMKTHETVSDQIGLIHKVHKGCKQLAEESVRAVSARATVNCGRVRNDFDGWLD
jgi:hypothetical protein